MNKINLDILYLIGDLNIGGTEKHLLSILPEIKKSGLNLYIYTFKKRGELADQFNENGVEVKTVIFSNILNTLPKFIKKPLGFFLNLIHLYYLIKKNKPKIIHMFLPEAYILGSTVLFFNKKIFKIMSRRSKNYYFDKNPFYKSIENFYHKKTNLLIGNSKSVCEDLKDECKIIKKIKLIYNGVNISKINKFNLSNDRIKQIKKKNNINENDVVIIFVANLIPYKNHDFFIDIINEILQKYKNLKILLIGQDRGIKKKLEEKLIYYNIYSNFIFYEEINNPEDLYLISDISINCSKHEGFSNSILESMSYGLPIVASNVGGNTESVEHNKNGFLFDLDDRHNFMKFLILLIKEKELRSLFGKNSLEISKKYYNINECINNYKNMYNKILYNK